MYSKEVLDHFSNPRNMGKIDKADGIGQVGNPTCGDMMTIYIKVAKSNGMEVIEDIKFETLGCAAAIATSSMVTEMARGKSLDEASQISYKNVLKQLGDLPAIKIHCSDLAVRGLGGAIEDYKKRKMQSQNQ